MIENSYLNLPFVEERLDGLAAYWQYILITQTIVLLLFIASPNFLLKGRPRLRIDGTLFAYSGWIWAETAKTPYLHLWDLKPPAIHELAALFSLLGGGSPGAIAFLSVTSMVVAVIVSIYLIGQLVFQYTGNEIAAYTAGTVPLAYPPYYRLAGTGLRPKHFTVLFGLLGVYLILNDRWGWGGFSTALAAGFWQLGIIFPVIGLSLSLSGDTNHREIRDIILGGLAAATLVVAPVLLSAPDAVSSMLVEVIGTPLWVVEPFQLGVRIEKFVDFTGVALPLVGLGIVGAASSIHYNRGGWVALGTCWYLLQVFRFDLDAAPDLLLLIVFVALGFGLLMDAVDEEVIPLCLVLGVVAIGFVQHGGLGGFIHPVGWQMDTGSLEALFWTGKTPQSCHVRLSGAETKFVEMAGELAERKRCYYPIIKPFG